MYHDRFADFREELRELLTTRPVGFHLNIDFVYITHISLVKIVLHIYFRNFWGNGIWHRSK